MANNFNDKVMYVEPNYSGAYYEEDRFGDEKIKYELAPDLSDYCIAVDLTVECKGRAVGAVTNSGNQTITMSWETNKDKNKISFHKGTTLHFNGIDKKDGYINALTTSYLDTYYMDIVNNGTNEMFGITSIDIQYNNYFVPEITIEFVDIKGVSLFAPEELRHSATQDGISGFAREDIAGSFFKSFFSFPYPKFSLTVKGFYGRPVTYELTCTDFRAKFDSNSGNFNASANFIGYAYSLLNDVTINCLLVAPYSDYIGKSYWQNKLSSTFKVYDKSGNSKEMPTMIQLIELMEKARTKEIKMSYDNPLFKEQQKLTNIGSLLNVMSNNYVSYVSDLKQTISDNISDVNNKIVLLFFENKNDSLNSILGESNDKVEMINQSYTLLLTSFNNFKNESGCNLGVPPDEYDIKADVIFKQIPNSDLYEINTSHTDYSKLSDEIKDKLNAKLNEININGKPFPKCCAVISDNGLTDFILSYQPQHNSKVESNDRSISEYRENILNDVLGFKPTVQNIMRIIMAHFETYIHMIMNVSETIDRNPRTLSSIGLGSLFTDVNVNLENVPPFPQCTSLIDGKVQDDWLGNYANTPEVDLIHGLLNGASTTNSLLENVTVNSPQNGSFTNIPYPYMLSDINNDVNIFSEIDDFDNISDVIGHIGLRMMNSIGIINFKNKNDIVEALAKADAKNFVKFNPRPTDNFLGKLSGNVLTPDYMFNILTNNQGNNIQQAKYNNSWAWDCKNIKSKALFENYQNNLIFNYYRVPSADNQNIVNYVNPLSYKSFNEISNDTFQDSNGYCKVPSDLSGYITVSDYRNEHTKITENDNIFKVMTDLTYVNNVVNQFANSDDDIIKEIPSLLNMTYNKNRYEDLCRFSNGDEALYKVSYFIKEPTLSLKSFKNNRLLDSVKRKKDDYCKENVFDRSDGWFTNYPVDVVYGVKSNELVKCSRDNIDDDEILENPNDASKYTLVQFYGFTHTNDALYQSSLISLFGQYYYYLQSSDEQKAFLYAFSLSGFYDLNELVGLLISDEYPFEYAPKMALVMLGALIWRYDTMQKTKREALNNDSFFTFNKNNDLNCRIGLSDERYTTLTKKIRSEIRNSLYNLFIDWTKSEFATIRNAYELKTNKGVITADYIKWFGQALESEDGFNNGRSIGDMLDYQSNNKLKDIYNNLEDYLTRTFTDDFFANYMSIKSVENNRSMKMYGVRLFNREGTSINATVTKSVYEPCLIIKGCFYKQESDVKKSLLIKENIHNTYMKVFLDELRKSYSNLTTNLTVTANGTPLARVTPTDVNIKIALYNYCKNVYDRWISGEKDNSTWDMENFFDKHFYFIDSYYNEIGQDVKINMEAFKEKVIDSQSQKAYTMLAFITDTIVQSKLQFVCVQNFSDLSDRDALEDMFKPIPYSEMPLPKKHPDFVTIYTYEPSRHLNINGDYTDDSFMLSDTIGYPEAIKSKKENRGYKIPAFGVSYGKMYQSYFQDIQVSMESPIVTEQAIKAQLILCNQANNQKSDDGNNSLFIGQDLFTIYSNNSYTCTVKMLGCAWVQPLMYFVLLNVPMFKGSYLIQSVSHHIEAGLMYTTFMGVRMAKTSTPIVDGYYLTETNKGSSNGIGGENVEDEYLRANINNNCPYKMFPVKGTYQGEPIITENEYGAKNPLPKYPQYNTLEEAICSTVYAEAGNQGDVGIALVASVIMNRYAKKKKWTEVLFQPQVAIGVKTYNEVSDNVKKICHDVCVNGMCSVLLGQRTDVTSPVYIYSANKNTGRKSESVEITIEHLQKLGAYCTTNGYGERKGDITKMERYPIYWRSAEYVLHHKGHVFTGQDNSTKQSLYWKQVSRPTKVIRGVSESAQGLFDAIVQTVNYTPSIKCSLSMEGRGNQMIITSDDNNKLSGVFDAILNTYYNHILKLFWVIKDNSLAYNPTKIYIEVKDGEVQSPTIALVTENGKFNYTRYTDYKTLSPNFLMSLNKKYGDLRDSNNMEIFKKECSNFLVNPTNENEVINIVSKESVGSCAMTNYSDDNNTNDLKLSDNELLKKCLKIPVISNTRADIDIWKNIVNNNNGKWNENGVNIIGIRSKKNYNGSYSNNQFNDVCVICYGDKKMVCEFTTVPGVSVLNQYKKYNNNGAAILKPGYYEAHTIGYHQGKYKAVVQRKGEVNVYRDKNGDKIYNYSNLTSGMFGINIHKSGNPQSTYVNNWSAGCQVFKRLSDFNKFMNILDQNGITDKNTIGYTLILEDMLK